VTPAFDDQIVFELGALTVAQIFMDQVITDLAIDLDETGNELQARADFMPRSFTEKIKYVDGRIQERVLDRSLAVRCSALLRRAKELAHHRNDLVHGHVFKHRQTDEVVLVNIGRNRKGRIHKIDAAEIAKLSEDIADVAFELLNESSAVRCSLPAAKKVE